MCTILNDMNLWEQILIRVETKVNRHSFYTWFKPTTFIGADSRTINVRVPNPLFKDWLTKHYSGVISEAMGELQKEFSLFFTGACVSDEPAREPAVGAGLCLHGI